MINTARSHDLAGHFDGMMFGIVDKQPRKGLFVQPWQLAHLPRIGNIPIQPSDNNHFSCDESS